ncbi:MAG: outer membrane lipoprotein-sorting protein [Magnetococcales bacterium]|nr:outer membrane lipoprotein-sorting protein [Magnetococcales bacterium]
MKRNDNFFLTLLLAVLLTLSATTAKAQDADDILRRVDRNLYPESMQMFYRVLHRTPNLEKSWMTIYLAHKKGNHTVALIIGPNELKGRTAMRDGDLIWMHVPGEMALREATLDKSFLGGVFTNADIFRQEFHLEYTPTLLEVTPDHFLLSLAPKKPTSPYSKIVMKVHRKLYVPMESTYYGGSGYPTKQFRYKAIRELSPELIRPSMIEAVNSTNPGYISIMRIGTLEARELPDSAFTKESLPRVGTLLK